MFLQQLMKKEDHWQGILQIVRTFNKHIANPITLSFAGRRNSPFAIVRHIGRRSDMLHSTPVVAARSQDMFTIPLPYGEETDWCQNILAAKTCTIVWQGKAYLAGVPEIIDENSGLTAFPGWVQRLLKFSAQRTGNNQFLRLEHLAQTSQTEYKSIIARHQLPPTVRAIALSIAGTIVAQIILRRLRRRAQASYPLDQ